MLYKGKIAVLLVALSLVAGCEEAEEHTARVGTAAAQVTIAENGVAEAVIVIAEDAPEPEQHAAAELAEFLQQIAGTTFEIVHGPAVGRLRLLVGPKAAKLAVADFSTDGLGSDGIIIRRVGKDLILAGGHPRGTLYAVYTFLEAYSQSRPT